MQENQSVLKEEFTNQIIPNKSIVEQMKSMGFHNDMIEMALKNVANNMDEAVEMLLRMQSSGKYEEVLTNLILSADSASGSGPSTSAKSFENEMEKNLKKQAELDEVS